MLPQSPQQRRSGAPWGGRVPHPLLRLVQRGARTQAETDLRVGRLAVVALERVRRALRSRLMSNGRVAEFFAGIGLVRLGLEAASFDVVWSNDIEIAKQEMYSRNFGVLGDHRFVLGDVGAVRGEDVPDVEVAWASFPCTDLSLAGWRRGLEGSQSSTFFHFVRIIREMGDRAPAVVALENVVGMATSRGGDDLRTAIAELNALGYSVDVLTLDARRFVPQSRPRLFLVGSKRPVRIGQQNQDLRPDWLQFVFDDPNLTTHQAELPAPPPPLRSGFSSLAERLSPAADEWWSAERTAAFVGSLSEIQSVRLEALRTARSVHYRTAYRRTRAGSPVWEIRADDLSGCLRTARGGSSKQAVVRAGRGTVKVRWMTAREYAKLMGAGGYILDGLRPLQAMFGFGDAVCVPAVQWLGEHYLAPLLAGEFAVSADSRAS